MVFLKPKMAQRFSFWFPVKTYQAGLPQESNPSDLPTAPPGPPAGRSTPFPPHRCCYSHLHPARGARVLWLGGGLKVSSFECTKHGQSISSQNNLDKLGIAQILGGVFPFAHRQLEHTSYSWGNAPHVEEQFEGLGETQSTPGTKMVNPEPCNEMKTRLQPFMAGVVPYFPPTTRVLIVTQVSFFDGPNRPRCTTPP